jgi:hypothetical protein
VAKVVQLSFFPNTQGVNGHNPSSLFSSLIVSHAFYLQSSAFVFTATPLLFCSSAVPLIQKKKHNKAVAGIRITNLLVG